MWQTTKTNNTTQIKLREHLTLTLHSLTSVCIFSIQLPEHFLGFWQGEFVQQSKASSAGNQELVWEWLTLFPNILLTLPQSPYGEARGKSRLPVSLFVVCLPPTLVPISPAHLETLRLSDISPKGRIPVKLLKQQYLWLVWLFPSVPDPLWEHLRHLTSLSRLQIDS